ncbi:MAG: XdhC/CoxI family protein, partial [Flavitalea sp.]
TNNGQLTGAISGGCLEGDALRKSQLVIMQQKSMLVTYDTNDEDDAKLGMGLGCNGIIHILIEPVNISDPYNPIAFLKTLIKKRQQAILVTLFDLKNKKNQRGTCFVYLKDGEQFGCADTLENGIFNDVFESLQNQTSLFKNYPDQHCKAFIQFIAPPVSLVILGAGNDVKPLVEFASILGWETTIIDGRPNYPTRERFPLATKLEVKKASELLQNITIDRQTIFLLMTHNYNYDLSALRILLEKETTYIGMLGPRKKLERMQQDLREQQSIASAEKIIHIHTPAGIDIGAETPEEIALSIMAEIKSVLSGRRANSLKTKTGVIHPRITTTIK